MPATFEENWTFAENWSGALKKIITDNIATIASVKPAAGVADKRTCTDFIVSTSNGNTVAARIRSDVANRFRDFTLRAKCGDQRTELDKIRDGYGDWYVYAWTADGALADWILVDLNRLRGSGLLEVPREIKWNTDGHTAFVAYKRHELRSADCLAAEMRPPIQHPTCGYGRHQWIDAMDGSRKKVVCERCGAFYGYYAAQSSPTCLPFVK